MGTRRRSFWGWGWEDAALGPEVQAGLAAALSARFQRELKVAPGPELDAIELSGPRLDPPVALAAICSQDRYHRAGHTYGKGYRDVVRGFRGEFPHPPDVVAFPRSEADVAALLDWCSSAGALLPVDWVDLAGDLPPPVSPKIAPPLTPPPQASFGL